MRMSLRSTPMRRAAVPEARIMDTVMRGALAAAVLVLLAACSPSSGPGEGSGEAGAPAGRTLVFLDGSRTAVEGLRGDWVFVNYWAEWCAPCLEEIPELNALHDEIDGARVIGINFDRLTPEEMRPQVAALGIAFPVAVDDAGEALDIEAPEVLPSTFVFDPDGRAVRVLRGPQTLEDLRAVMGAAPAAIGGP